MHNFLLGISFVEHHKYPRGEAIPEGTFAIMPNPICFQDQTDRVCVCINDDNTLHTSYYIGADWIDKDKVIYIEPKLNKNAIEQTDFLSMLFSALKHPEVAAHTKGLFEIKWDKPQIELKQQQDLLTPLLVVQFLGVVKEIVRKGLKKSYYKTERNLHARVKGKILVGQTIKKNLVQNKPLKTFCSFDEFGWNGLENRLLKRALVFVQRYLPTMKNLQAEKYSDEMFNFINPAFEAVSEDVELHDVMHTATNIFYKEYAEGLRLAKLILKRFGYNINNTAKGMVKTPPFWIDMSKLFELYVLGLLADAHPTKIDYHTSTYGNELDFLYKDKVSPLIIDAKYKPRYIGALDHSDIRQVSGYARLEKVYNMLEKAKNEMIDCVIIFPDQNCGIYNLKNVKLNSDNNKIEQYVGVFKQGIVLPVIPSDPNL